jgi:pimeloyl-ACP methyl ester carboxylesterase
LLQSFIHSSLNKGYLLNKPEIGIIFIYGAGLRKSIWQEIQPLIKIPGLLAEFPGREKGPNTTSGLSLSEYLNTILDQVKDFDTQKIVIAAHSIGGIIGLMLASALENRLAGFAAIGAAIPKNGGSFISCLPAPKRFIFPIMLRLFGTRPPDSVIRKSLCNDLSDEHAENIINSFVPESYSIYTQKSNSKIPEVPKIYIRTINDSDWDLEIQNSMVKNFNPKKVADINSGHLPMVRRPKELADILNSFIEDEITIL